MLLLIYTFMDTSSLVIAFFHRLSLESKLSSIGNLLDRNGLEHLIFW